MMDCSKLQVEISSELFFEMKRKIDILTEQIEQQHNFHDILNNDLICTSQKLDAAEKEIENLRQQLVNWIIKAGYDPTDSVNQWGKRLSDHMLNELSK